MVKGLFHALAMALPAAALALSGCRDEVERLEWPTMGTVAAVQSRFSATGRRHIETSLYRDAAKRSFGEVERLLNAYDPGSEICRLASLPDDEILAKCDARMRPCYKTAFRLARESGGAFNPRWRGPGTLDLGAIAKGFALDLADIYCDTDLLVDLGGNLKAMVSEPKSARGWRVGVKDPDGDGFAATIELKPGESLATSAEYYRGRHIYDGRTGRPAESGVKSVTVLCRSAMLADGLSTVLFILGPDEGLRFLRDHGYEASVLFVMSGGRIVRGGIPADWDAGA